jgi:hypothetical protein
MYPTQTHLIRYKNSYLGKSNKLFGFITNTAAKCVIDRIVYDNISVRQSDKSTYIVNVKPPKPNNKDDMVLLKPIARKFLKIQSFDLSVGNFFATINNTEMIYIDKVIVNNIDGNLTLHSNFSIDDVVDVELYDKINHLDNIFNKSKGERIDYKYEMGQVIMDRFSGFEDDFF